MFWLPIKPSSSVSINQSTKKQVIIGIYARNINNTFDDSLSDCARDTTKSFYVTKNTKAVGPLLVE
jgi:hypothetical protein